MPGKMTEDKFKEVKEKAREKRKRIGDIISKSKTMLFEIEEKRIERTTAYRAGNNSLHIEKEMDKLYSGLTEEYINFIEESKIYDELMEQIYYHNKEREKAEKAIEEQEKRRNLQKLVDFAR